MLCYAGAPVHLATTEIAVRSLMPATRRLVSALALSASMYRRHRSAATAHLGRTAVCARAPIRVWTDLVVTEERASSSTSHVTASLPGQISVEFICTYPPRISFIYSNPLYHCHSARCLWVTVLIHKLTSDFSILRQTSQLRCLPLMDTSGSVVCGFTQCVDLKTMF